MTFTTIVHNLLHPEARIQPCEQGELHVIEADSSASLKKVIIQMPKKEVSIAAFALDFKIQRVKGSSPACLSEILNADCMHPLRSACDAVICVDEGSTTHLIHIEMKSRMDKRAINQLRNSKRFTQFLRGLAEEWHGVSGNYLEWYVLLLGIKEKSTRKRKTAISRAANPQAQPPSKDSTKPAIFMMKSGDRIHLGQLYKRVS